MFIDLFSGTENVLHFMRFFPFVFAVLFFIAIKVQGRIEWKWDRKFVLRSLLIAGICGGAFSPICMHIGWEIGGLGGLWRRGSSWSIGLFKREMLETAVGKGIEGRKSMCGVYMAYSECYDIIKRLCWGGFLIIPTIELLGFNDLEGVGILWVQGNVWSFELLYLTLHF